MMQLNQLINQSFICRQI